ncbi:MAG TPA: S41 family peptidase [Parafilimonas sp.]
MAFVNRFPFSQKNLIKIFFILFFLFNSLLSFSQPVNKAATNAYIISRMAEKFHIQPRILNDSLSNDFFNQLLKQLDEDHIYFNKEDITHLSAYKFQLDDQIKQQKTDFLKLITAIYTKRLQQADTIIDDIGKKTLNFSVTEKFTVAEDLSYPADVISMNNKLYKKIKLEVLSNLLDLNDKLSLKNPSKQKQILDSAQFVFQKKVQSVYKRDITRILQSPGGVEQFVANEYCKALASCYDPHTEFFPLTEEENFESELGNQQFRFGFAIKEDDDGGVSINDLEPGSPAFKCGLLNKGDKFQTLQWQGQNAIDVSDADAKELGDILSQSNHDKITVTVKKEDGTLRTVTLIKAQEEADDDTKVKSFLLKGDKTFGYISLPAFYNNWEDESTGNNGCANDVAKEVLKLKKENITGLILDLRYNGGGSIQEAVELAGIFIDAGPVAQMKSRSDEKIFTLKDVNRGTIYDGPLLILVNGYSASASELVAGSLQDYNRALIVGSSTYGKATGQIVLPLDTTININADNSDKKADNYLKVTTDKLYRITGKTAQFTGVTPDIVLPDFLQADPQREADDPFALLPTNVDANKYYQPYPKLPVASLQSIAKQDADTIKYFHQLQQYIDQYKLINASHDVSLNWKDALAEEKTDSLPAVVDTINFAVKYSIQNNAYDLEKLKADASPNDINEEFIKYLSHDPYIKISYDLLTAITK